MKSRYDKDDHYWGDDFKGPLTTFQLVLTLIMVTCHTLAVCLLMGIIGAEIQCIIK